MEVGHCVGFAAVGAIALGFMWRRKYAGKCDEIVRTRKRVCVFCGSQNGDDGKFVEMAYLVGKKMAERDVELVYGGGDVGLMGAVSRGVKENGGFVIGILPRALINRELKGSECPNSKLYLVDTMHERKQMMAEHCDAYLALPGGVGTFEEIFEAITWTALGIQNKTVGLFNIDGFYDPLNQLMETAFSKKFIKSRRVLNIVVTETEVDALLDKVLEPRPENPNARWNIKS